MVERYSERGFTILETTIALIIMAIVGLGVASAFSYAARNTSNTNDRELSMAVAQQSMEQLRNASFADPSLSATPSGGTTTRVTRAGRQYSIVATITDSNVVNSQATLKTISVLVTPLAAPNSPWLSTVTSLFGSVTLTTQRSAPVVGPNRTL